VHGKQRVGQDEERVHSVASTEAAHALDVFGIPRGTRDDIVPWVPRQSVDDRAGRRVVGIEHDADASEWYAEPAEQPQSLPRHPCLGRRRERGDISYRAREARGDGIFAELGVSDDDDRNFRRALARRACSRSSDRDDHVDVEGHELGRQHGQRFAVSIGGPPPLDVDDRCPHHPRDRICLAQNADARDACAGRPRFGKLRSSQRGDCNRAEKRTAIDHRCGTALQSSRPLSGG
jgi:hypothetical protein